MNKFHYLFHSIAYYIAWFSCIPLAARGFAWVSTFIVILCVLLQIYWQYKVHKSTLGLWYLIAIIVLFSTLVDSLLVYSNVVVLSANPFSPYFTSPWLITLWISLALFMYGTLSHLFKHLILLGILSFIGFAFAFASGAKMGAVFFPYGYETCFLIGAIWLILLPLLIYCYERILNII
jgi:hypothetical protein